MQLTQALEIGCLEFQGGDCNSLLLQYQFDGDLFYKPLK